jgi:hypothetical protein
MNNKGKRLPFRRLGITRRGLRKNRGRREASLPFSKIVLGDSQLLKSPERLKGVNKCQGLQPWSVGFVKGIIGTETAPTEMTRQELSMLFSKRKQWRIWAAECQGSMQPWTTDKQNFNHT